MLADSGDTLHRDALDLRVIDDLRTCGGRVIDRTDDVGGWPSLAAAPAAQDTDGDGLPDDWEATRPALSPNRADDVWATDTSTGQPLIESYLSELAGDRSGPD